MVNTSHTHSLSQPTSSRDRPSVSPTWLVAVTMPLLYHTTFIVPDTRNSTSSITCSPHTMAAPHTRPQHLDTLQSIKTTLHTLKPAVPYRPNNKHSNQEALFLSNDNHNRHQWSTHYSSATDPREKNHNPCLTGVGCSPTTSSPQATVQALIGNSEQHMMIRQPAQLISQLRGPQPLNSTPDITPQGLWATARHHSCHPTPVYMCLSDKMILLQPAVDGCLSFRIDVTL